MKTRLQRYISYLLMLCMVLAMCSVPVYAADRITVSALTIAKEPAAGNWTKYSGLVIYGKSKAAGYNINVPKDGTYHITVRVAAESEADLYGTVGGKSEHIIFKTGGTTTWENIYLGSYNLTEGDNILTLELKSGSTYSLKEIYAEAGTVRIDTDFSKKTGPFKNYYLPAKIEAEDFDMGAAGFNAISKDPIATDYRSDCYLTIESGTSRTIQLRDGEWTLYTFNVENAGSYDVSAITASGGTLEMYFDGSIGCLSAEAQGAGETPAGTIYLEKGTHTLKITPDGTMMKIDSIRMTTSSNQGKKPSELPVKVVATGDEQEEVRKVYKNLYVENGAVNGDGSKEKPFGTIEEAQAAVRTLRDNMDGDIVVNIASGEYELEKRLEFRNEDGGKNGYKIVYKGTNQLNPPIISGGSHVTGWKKAENNLWVAKVDHVDDVRQLYIDGYPAQRSRTKYVYQGSADYDDPNNEYPVDGQYIDKRNFPVLSNPEDVELVCNLLWTNQRVPLANILETEDSFILVYDQPYYEYARTKYYETSTPWTGNKFYLENAYELTDEPGEFYFDKKTKEIFYYPYPEEDMTKVDAVIGRTEFMLYAEGTSKENRIKDITFENLDFRYGTWLDANRTGVIVFQADCILDEEMNSQLQTTGRTMPGQLEFVNAKNIIIKNCNFQNLGSAAIEMSDFVDDSLIKGNVFRDISGTAVSIGSWRFRKADNPQPSDVCKNNTVTNNLIRRIGMEYYGCPAIGTYYAHATTVSYNDIEDIPYTGVSIGWGWGSAMSKTIDCSGHQIHNNRIVDISKTVRDGGHTYTLSDMPNTVIEYNYMEKSEDYGGAYFDSGSSNITVRNNVMKDCLNWTFNPVGSGKTGNETYNNYSNTDLQPQWALKEPAEGQRVEEAIKVYDANWTGEALEIVQNAGLQQGYKRLLGGNDKYPAWRLLELEHAPLYAYSSPNIMERYAYDYMEGGEGVAFHKISGTKEPREYKQGAGVVIGGTFPGEWIAYDFDFEKTGTFDFELCFACAPASTEVAADNDTGIGPKASVYLDGVKVIDSAPLGYTGSWNAHAPKIIGQFNIDKPGKHIVKVELVDNAWSFEKFRMIHTDMTSTDEYYDDCIPKRIGGNINE